MHPQTMGHRMTAHRQAIRPEETSPSAARPEAGSAADGLSVILSSVAGAGVTACLALVIASPFLAALRGPAALTAMIAAGVFSLAAFACAAAACARLRRRQSPAKFVAWLALPPAAFLLAVTAVTGWRMISAYCAETMRDPAGRYSLTRPDAGWRFLARPVTGEGAEMEMVRVSGAEMHVVARTDRGSSNGAELLGELARLRMLPGTADEHEHGESPRRKEQYEIRSVEIMVGERTASELKEMFEKEIAKLTLELESRRGALLRKENAPEEAAAAVERQEEILQSMKDVAAADALGPMVRYLSSRRRRGVAYLAVSRQATALDGREAVSLLVRGRAANGEEFAQIIRFAVRGGTAYAVECFARAADEAEFERIAAGFRFAENAS